MTKTIRKTRTLTQKQKRPTAHQIGKRFTTPKAKPMTVSEKHKLLLSTNKNYQKLEIQRTIGYLLLAPMTAGMLLLGFILLVLAIVGFFAFMIEIQLAQKPRLMELLGPTLKSYQPSIFEVIKSYLMAHPILVIVSSILFVIGLLVIHYTEKSQKALMAKVNWESLQKGYTALKERGVIHDR